MSKRISGYELLFPDRNAIALIKDKHFDDTSDDEFRRLLLYNGLIDKDSKPTEWSKVKGLLESFLCTLNEDGTFGIKPDRLSPAYSLTMVSSSGIKYIGAIIKDSAVTIGSILGSQVTA
jgi:hypothetical protein